MTRERFGAALSCLAVFVLAASWPALADEKEPLFRIESKVEKPGSRKGTLEFTYSLVNTSSQRITAWDFGCIEMLQDGTEGGLTRTAVDGYRSLEMRFQGREGLPLGEEILEPNQRIEKTIVFDRDKQSGPYAAKSCGPLVAIFEDATFEGSKDLADSHFERRTQEAIQARRTYRDLEQRLEQGTPLAAAVESISAKPGRPLEGASQAIHRGIPVTPAMIFDELENDYQWAFKHLPAQWREQVAKELQ